MKLPNTGYQPPIIQVGDYIHGDHLLGDIATNPIGDWSAFLPSDEFQDRGFETYSCVSEATLHCVEILQRRTYGDTTQYSVRFLAQQSGTGSKGGNDDNTVAETLRKEGCCAETDWPFNVANYEAFYTPPPTNVIKLAKVQFADNSFGHSWVVDTSPQGMMNALTFSPLALGVYAWAEPDANGIYHRPPGAEDCHEITVYDYDRVNHQYWCIFDSYDNTHKRLAWDYGFGMGKRFTLNRVVPTSPNPTGWINWPLFVNWIRGLLGL